MPGEPVIGDRVLSADGEELGKVKRVEDVAFLLDVPAEPDYWFNKTDVASVEAGTVHMAFPAAALSEHAIRYGDVI
jgi:hypothetical protein